MDNGSALLYYLLAHGDVRQPPNYGRTDKWKMVLPYSTDGTGNLIELFLPISVYSNMDIDYNSKEII
ncbi:MAG: hypothetical protein ABIJ12_10575 [bacterium]